MWITRPVLRILFFISYPVLYFLKRNALQYKLQLLLVNQPATTTSRKNRYLVASFFQTLIIERKTFPHVGVALI